MLEYSQNPPDTHIISFEEYLPSDDLSDGYYNTPQQARPAASVVRLPVKLHRLAK